MYQNMTDAQVRASIKRGDSSAKAANLDAVRELQRRRREGRVIYANAQGGYSSVTSDRQVPDRSPHYTGPRLKRLQEGSAEYDKAIAVLQGGQDATSLGKSVR